MLQLTEIRCSVWWLFSERSSVPSVPSLSERNEDQCSVFCLRTVTDSLGSLVRLSHILGEQTFFPELFHLWKTDLGSGNTLIISISLHFFLLLFLSQWIRNLKPKLLLNEVCLVWKAEKTICLGYTHLHPVGSCLNVFYRSVQSLESSINSSRDMSEVWLGSWMGQAS